MRLKVLVSIISLLIGANATLRGVAPQDESKYIPTAGNKWSCLNHPEIVIDFSQVNDNYCDCPDGSDEPGTSLCYNGFFYCENKGHFPNFIPSFQVDDGVCDYELCCDGSDENGTIDCPNRCQELHEVYEREKIERETVIKKGLLKLSKLTKIAQEEKDELLNELKTLNNKLSEKRAILLDLIKNYDPSKDEEEESIINKLSPLLNKVGDRISSQSSKINELNGEVKKLESILEKLSEEYNPNFNDPAVKESIKNFQDYIVNKETETITDKDENVVTELVDEISKLEITPVVGTSTPTTPVGILETIQTLFYQFIGIEPDSSSPSSSPNGKQSSREIEDLKNEISSIEDEYNQLSLELNSSNYGPNDILRSYKDKCLTKKYGEYDYKYCFTGTINQQGHGNSVLIGKYSKFETQQESGGAMRLIYEDGAKCWNGPIRKGIIHVECGEDDELISVTEPEVCQYYFKVKSPIACINENGNDTPLIVKDEL